MVIRNGGGGEGLVVGLLCEFEPYTVDVDDLDGGVGLEVLAELGDVDVHAACGEVGVVLPNLLEGGGAVDELVEVDAEEAEELAFLGGEALGFLTVAGEGLVVVVEAELADGELVVLGLVFVEGAADGGVDASEEFFHAEGLGDVVVGADLETLELVGLEGLGGEEEDGDVFVDAAQFLGDGEAVLDGHHDVEDAGIDAVGLVDVEGLLTVDGEENGIAFLGEVGLEDGTHVGVVFGH